ncbi:MAG: hypothetical protein KIG36_01980 [Eubacteriales bacterium]|nr:hypothetical protein [Eubacteriales bacterium]
MIQRDEKGRFIKGVCPNPAGRGGKKNGTADLFRNASLRAVKTLIRAMDDEALTANGRLEAAKEILNRVYGRSATFSEEEEGDVVLVRMEEEIEEYAK